MGESKTGVDEMQLEDGWFPKLYRAGRSSPQKRKAVRPFCLIQAISGWGIGSAAQQLFLANLPPRSVLLVLGEPARYHLQPPLERCTNWDREYSVLRACHSCYPGS